MLRLIVALAVWVLSGLARAQVLEPAAQAAATAKTAADAIILTGPVGAVFILAVIGMLAACTVLGFVIRALWKTIQGRDAMIATLQDKRAADAAVNSKLLAEVATTGSTAISANTTAQAEMTSRMLVLADIARPLGPELGRVIAGLDRNADKIDDLAKTVGAGCRA